MSVAMDPCYEALNGSCVKFVQPNGVRVPVLVAMMATTAATVIGNLLVIVSIGHFRQLHTPTNQLILSLALCDFLLGLLVMPLSAARSLQGCWHFGDFLCKLHTCVDITLSTASIFHLVSVSAERCSAVCGALTYQVRFGPSTVLLTIFSCWLIPALFACAVTFFGDEVFYVDQVGTCHVLFSRGLAVATSLVSFYIPGLAIIGIYCKIYTVARNQARSISAQLKQLRRSYPSGSGRRRTRKATTTIAIVVGVFLICWTPFFLCNVLHPFIDCAIPPAVTDALVWFGYANSALNPFIYAFMHSWFRRAVRIIATGKIFLNSSRRIRLYS